MTTKGLDIGMPHNGRMVVSTTPPRDKKPPKAVSMVYGVFTEGGVNYGGACTSCGDPLQFWFHFKQCERCLEGRSRGVRK